MEYFSCGCSFNSTEQVWGAIAFYREKSTGVCVKKAFFTYFNSLSKILVGNIFFMLTMSAVI